MLSKKEQETIFLCFMFTLGCIAILGVCWVFVTYVPDVVFPPSPYNFPPAMD